MKALQNMADILRREARGIGDTGATILANAAAQPVQGYAMLARLLAGDDLGAAVEKGQRISYAPRTAEGARNLGAIGDAAEWALQYPTRAVDAVGERSPVAGAGLLAGAAVLDPTKGAGRLAKALRYDAGSPQALLPGVDPLTPGQLHERAARDLGEAGAAVRAAQEAADASQFAPHNRILGAQPTRDVPPELAAKLSDAIRRNRAAREAETLARAGHIRAQRDMPGDTLDAAEAREADLLRMKSDGDIEATGRDLSTSRNLVRQLRQAQSHMAPPEPELPAWARDLTDDPSGRGRGGAPAGADWWQEQLAQPPASVAEFLRSVRDVPEAFTYGLEPPSSVQSLDDYAAWFSQQDPKKRRVRVDYEGGSSDEDAYIKRPKEHGRGEVMYDRWGDPKGDTRTHDAGDYPMYDESGNVKKDIDPDTGEKAKRRAAGGEPKRDRYGDEVFEPRKSRGGEQVRDEGGDIVYEEVENPDYREGGGAAYLRAGGDEIKIDDWDSGRPSVYAIDAGDSGALLYQTLLAHASREGYPIGKSVLTDDNRLRLLSNTLANAARTGTNPRDVTGTSSGVRPKAKGQAEGDRIWQALAGETDARIAHHGGDPGAVRFTGEGFVGADGIPLAPRDIAQRLDEFSPEVETSKAGLKTVMQNAVFKWLEQADPEQARRAARSWSRVGGPLFGIAGGAVGLEALTEHMRNQQAERGPQ